MAFRSGCHGENKIVFEAWKHQRCILALRVAVLSIRHRERCVVERRQGVVLTANQ